MTFFGARFPDLSHLPVDFVWNAAVKKIILEKFSLASPGYLADGLLKVIFASSQERIDTMSQFLEDSGLTTDLQTAAARAMILERYCVGNGPVSPPAPVPSPPANPWIAIQANYIAAKTALNTTIDFLIEYFEGFPQYFPLLHLGGQGSTADQVQDRRSEIRTFVVGLRDAIFLTCPSTTSSMLTVDFDAVADVSGLYPVVWANSWLQQDYWQGLSVRAKQFLQLRCDHFIVAEMAVFSNLHHDVSVFLHADRAVRVSSSTAGGQSIALDDSTSENAREIVHCVTTIRKKGWSFNPITQLPYTVPHSTAPLKLLYWAYPKAKAEFYNLVRDVENWTFRFMSSMLSRPGSRYSQHVTIVAARFRSAGPGPGSVLVSYLDCCSSTSVEDSYVQAFVQAVSRASVFDARDPEQYVLQIMTAVDHLQHFQTVAALEPIHIDFSIAQRFLAMAVLSTLSKVDPGASCSGVILQFLDRNRHSATFQESPEDPSILGLPHLFRSKPDSFYDLNRLLSALSSLFKHLPRQKGSQQLQNHSSAAACLEQKFGLPSSTSRRRCRAEPMNEFPCLPKHDKDGCAFSFPTMSSDAAHCSWCADMNSNGSRLFKLASSSCAPF